MQNRVRWWADKENKEYLLLAVVAAMKHQLPGRPAVHGPTESAQQASERHAQPPEAFVAHAAHALSAKDTIRLTNGKIDRQPKLINNAFAVACSNDVERPGPSCCGQQN